jgi:hypothetical protein
MPLVRRTRATFRRAEFGFFGVTVRTIVHTPRLKGFSFSAGDFDFTFGTLRPFLTNWLTVGIYLCIVSCFRFVQSANSPVGK